MSERKMPDGRTLTPARENPWYIMMTLHGEQEGGEIDWALAKKNSALWNMWLGRHLGATSGNSLARQLSIERSKFHWPKTRYEDIEELFRQRSSEPLGQFEISRMDTPICMENLIFEKPFYLDRAILPALRISRSSFDKRSSFGNCTFLGAMDANRTKFHSLADFSRSEFRDRVDFGNSDFLGRADFWSAEFQRKSDFHISTFVKAADFRDTKWVGDASFRAAEFKRSANFESADFTTECNFSDATFEVDAGFEKAIFNGGADFPDAHFKRGVTFRRAKFRDVVPFGNTTFGTEGDKTSGVLVLNLANFNAPLSMVGAMFKGFMPWLDGAELPTDTLMSVQPENWPPKRPGPLSQIDISLRLRKPEPEDLEPAFNAKASAAKLRHVMSKQALPEEEHFFFRREMHYAARSEPFYKTAHIYLFELVSDFGYSIARPAAFLTALWAIGAMFYTFIANFTFGQAASYSFSTMFKFFGFQRTYMERETECLGNIPWGEPFAATQTVLAFILLFFLGLGLRTRFRLR